MNHLLPLLVLSAGPSFTSADISQRTQAAEAWSRRHGVALSASAIEARHERGLDCITLRAPAPTGCRQTVELCTFGIFGGVCSGSWTTNFGLQLADGGSTFDVIERFGWSVDSYECENATQEVMWLIDGGLARVPSSWRRQEVARCLRDARAEAAREETNLGCDVMAVNPCRGEAYLVCRGRLSGAPYRRTSWVSWADGGDEAAREHPIDFVEDAEERDGGG